ncbi:hypothetical protein PGB28_01705 [Primorskyibacter aestuariivivens]|uniref:hypothetical protein n=1 Tax=Primorskyibacter aestuariivivens TaxID=1888912 RepID=UPI0023002CD0|nr:hypothetical protein [Primorskyibacter aestuariivivens]MDA7427156.1 hypothetical protein [Primorskyibacter aestuariivivens]
MKPDFALSLSFDGIALLKRASVSGGPEDGWFRLGEVSLTEADLGAALQALRAPVLTDAQGPGPEVKLLLPEEQVRFMTVEAGEDRAACVRAVEQALDGATPYAVSDLVYDWVQTGDQLHVAAVARETLAEAETFANDHDFIPLCFVTVPPKGNAFPREPFFGPTRTALTSLTPGVTVTGDELPIAILGDAPTEDTPPAAPDTAQETDKPVAAKAPPKAAADPEDKAAPAAAKTAQAQDAQEHASKPAADDAQQQPRKTAQADDAKARPGDEKAADSAKPKTSPEPAKGQKAADVPPAGQNKNAGQDKKVAQGGDQGKAGPAAQKAGQAKTGQAKAGGQGKPGGQGKETAQKSTDAPKPALAKGKAAADNAAQDKGAAKDQAGNAEKAAAQAPGPLRSPTDAAGAAKPLAGADKAAATDKAPAVPGFASIRARRDDGTGNPAPSLSTNAAPAGARPAPDPVNTALSEQEQLAEQAKASLTERPKAEDLGSETDETDQTNSTGQRAASFAASAIARASTGLGKGIGFVSRRNTSRTDPGTDAPKPAPAPAKGGRPRFRLRPKGAATAMTAEAMMDESERMTVFGARGQAKVGGKPRFLGVILTSILLLFLLAIGAWASLFLDGGLASLFRRDDAPVVASVTPDVRESEIETPAPASQIPETALTLPVPEEAQNEDSINVASLSAGVPALSEDLVDDQLNGLSVPFEAEALTPEQAEARYAATGIWQRAPAPPDEPQQGILADLYVASIDPGVDQGDAVALAALREHLSDLPPEPKRNPLPFDSGLTFDDDGLIEPTPEGVVVPGGYTLILGAPEVKPPQRPAETLGDLAPAPAAPQADEDAPVVVDDTLAGFRPRPRPDNLIEQNERANLGGISLSELAAKRPRVRPEVSEEKTEGEADETATEFAVATSIKPNRRPSGFASLVERARENEENEVVRTAAVAPRTVQPSIPSSANVAREATIRNAINLRKVNLIGVYGKPSARRALVRLSNGRYKKVKVGDRIDGGRVAAIGDDRLSYTKGGRQIVLRMPSG